jgi:two-component system, chemotaxis family, chemotaxis protein CheY
MTSSAVLVVHADENVSVAIQHALESDGIRVHLAMDGLEALTAVEQETPAIIITDTMLPRLDGVTLLKALRRRKDTRETPVIIISGQVESDAMLTGFAAGARYYVTLPFQPDDLRAKVRRLLQS